MNGSIAESVLNTASDILRAPVTAGSGELLGHVEDMAINRFSGKVNFLVVRSRSADSSAGQGQVSVRLSWKDLKVDAAGDRLVLLPGRSPVKRLLLRNAGLAGTAAVH
ncbi:PRC-barrel domain containing protein [Proteobacteria bacterium 005FR1]|nr:PRC-barrel domain containing protein [Proteobacteria bacterium 005FR1]